MRVRTYNPQPAEVVTFLELTLRLVECFASHPPQNAEGWGTLGRPRLLHYDGPGGIGIEGGHGGCRFCRGFAQILLDQYAVLVDHEGHHA